MKTPTPLTDEQINDVCVDTHLKNERPFATNIEAFTAIARAIEAAVNAKWQEMLSKQEPVAWAMRRDDGLVLDVICPEEHESYEVEYTMPLYAAPQPAQQEPVAWRMRLKDGSWKLFYTNQGWKDPTGLEPLYAAPSFALRLKLERV